MHRQYHSCPASEIILGKKLIFTHPAQVHTSSTNVGSYITNLMFIQPKFPNTGEPQVHKFTHIIGSHHWNHQFRNKSVPKQRYQVHVAKPSNLMPYRCTCLPLDTKYSR